MTMELFSEVDGYLTSQLVGADGPLELALAASEAAGLPPIQVSASQGKLLHILALTVGARRILEVGTLGGYSSIWLARALPADGRLVTLELNPHHAEVASKNLAHAGLADRSEIRLGPAMESLQAMHAAGEEPFDLSFIDADKASIPGYYEWALKLSRPGSLIIVDNVVRGGAVVDAESEDPDIQGVRTLLANLQSDRRVIATALQTVGAKGYDGFAVLRVAR